MRREGSVSVVIPSRNRKGQLEACLRSLEKSDYPDFEVIVVDDCSDEDFSGAMMEEHPKVRVIRNSTRRLLAYSRNVGAKASTGNLIFFVDDDNVVARDTISELVAVFSLAPSVAVSCPVIYFANRTDDVWTSDIRKSRFPGFYTLGNAAPSRTVQTFSFHNSFMVRRDVFEGLGGFDSNNFPIHIGELDFAYRLKARGYTALVNPKARVWHDVARTHMHVDSARSFYTLRNRILLLRRYETPGTCWAYVLGILPPLTLYYLAHHLVSASDGRFSASYNLVKGVVYALAAREGRGRQE